MGICITKNAAIVQQSVEQVEVQAAGEMGEGSSSQLAAASAASTRNKNTEKTFNLNSLVEPDIDEDIPKDFFPSIVSDQELRCRDRIGTMSSEVLDNNQSELLSKWEEEGFLSEINLHAFSIPAECSSSIKDLAQSLTANNSKYLQVLKDDEFSVSLAKAYVIYVWVANNIDSKWSATNRHCFYEDNGDLNEILEDRTGNASAFSSLYAALCKEAGLKVERANGNIRQWRSTTGEDFQPSQANSHFWNIVTIGKVTFIVDTMLGSGYYSLSMNFIKKFTHHYFGVPPQYSILTHWPSEPSQQHLMPPMLLQDLQSLIPVDMLTLGSGIVPLCWSEVIDVSMLESSSGSDPTTFISLRLKHNTDNMYVRARLLPASLSEDFQEEEFQNLVFIESCSENEFHIHTVLPKAGKFVLNVYLQNTPIPDKLHLSYIINSTVEKGSRVGYPFIFPTAAKAFKFKPLYWNKNRKSYDCVHSGENTLPIVFEADKNTTFYHCIVQGKVDTLNTNQPSSILLYNTMLVMDKKRLFQLMAVFPSDGWWTIHLSAAKLSEDDDTVSGYTTLLTYKVYVENGKPEKSYPHVLKPNSVFFGSDPIKTPHSSPLKLLFAMHNDHDLVNYVTCNQEAGESLEGYSTVDCIDTVDDGKYKSYQLKAVFPKPDTWFVHVFSRRNSNGMYTATFKLKLEITEALHNKTLLQSIDETRKHCGISFVDSGIITFEDDGKPFSFSFTAPASGIDFLHSLKLQDDENAVDYRTHFVAHDKKGNTEQSEYSLTVLFPERGNWRIESYALNSKMGDNDYSLVTEIKLYVSNPVPALCYPKIWPAFKDLGMKIREVDALIQATCTTGEFKLSFQAPEHTHFLCNLDNLEANNPSQQAYVHSMPDSQERILHMVFPNLGDWKVALFAKQRSQNESKREEYVQIMQLSLNNTVCKAGLSFPQIFEGFYKFNIHLAAEDIPLPSVLNVGEGLQHLLLKFYSPEGVKFLHYGSFTDSDDEKNLEKSGVRERKMTTMMSNPDTGLHQVQIEVNKIGQWTLYLFAESLPNSDTEWTPILQYQFHAVQCIK